ncbi:MATE family efflux transporter [Vibrio mediterranei]|uniref:MATE family efflux transporter n=1 Tax=Vibrio mediterranei TaxID=689 RepID=UPI002283ED38|nr:MATE family efflux transporter [Vibrio mediterranei]MCY9852578.1 MATE family efflux transporter [Vibrio mediterranei]
MSSYQDAAKTPSPLSYLDLSMLKSLWTTALPITLQTILFSSKGVVDVLMLGQLTEFDVAAAGVATKILFVATILLSGISTGGAMLAAQYFGANDNKGLVRSISLTWLMTSLAAVGSILILYLKGISVISIASDEIALSQLANTYLLFAAPSLLFMAYQTSIAAGLRSIHQASTATLFSALGIVLNILFNWLLIFGYFGFPELGLKGAALGTTLAALCESILLWLFLHKRDSVLALKVSGFFKSLTLSELKHFLSLSIPTTVNFLLWAIGVFIYTAIMGQTGTEGLVVLSIISPIEAFSLSLLVGVANASAVVVGNNLGAKEYDRAYYQAAFFAVIATIATLIVSVTLYSQKGSILSLFSALTPESIALAESFFLILCFGIVLRSIPTVMVVGVLRAGGDVKFCLYQDLLTQWCFGLPIAAFLAVYLKLPADIVFISFFFEAVFKWFACLYRFKSRAWMNHLAK